MFQARKFKFFFLKTLFFLFFFLIGITPGFSQQSKVDSLKSLLAKSAEDTNRVNLLNEIGGRLILKGGYPEAQNYLAQSKLLGKQLNFKKGLATCLNYLGNIDSRQNQHSSALDFYHSSLKIREDAAYPQL